MREGCGAATGRRPRVRRPPRDGAPTTQLRNASVDRQYRAENRLGNGATRNMTDPGTPYSLDHDSQVHFDDVRHDAAY